MGRHLCFLRMGRQRRRLKDQPKDCSPEQFFFVCRRRAGVLCPRKRCHCHAYAGPERDPVSEAESAQSAASLYTQRDTVRLSVVRSFRDGDPQKEKYIRSCTGVDRRYAALGIALLAGAFFALMYYLATTCDPVGVFRLFLHKYMPTVFPRPLNVYHS